MVRCEPLHCHRSLSARLPGGRCLADGPIIDDPEGGGPQLNASDYRAPSVTFSQHGATSIGIGDDAALPPQQELLPPTEASVGALHANRHLQQWPYRHSRRCAAQPDCWLVAVAGRVIRPDVLADINSAGVVDLGQQRVR